MVHNIVEDEQERVARDILSDITIHMKYARFIPEKNRREVWKEIVGRNKKMHTKKYPDLKKDINYVLGDIIEAVYIWELTNADKDNKKAEAIIDEAIVTFDDLITKVNQKDVENKKKHFKAINTELEERGRKLIDKINAL